MHAGPDSSGGRRSGLAWGCSSKLLPKGGIWPQSPGCGKASGSEIDQFINVQPDRARESWEAEPLQIFPVRLRASQLGGRSEAISDPGVCKPVGPVAREG